MLLFPAELKLYCALFSLLKVERLQASHVAPPVAAILPLDRLQRRSINHNTSRWAAPAVHHSGE